MTQQDADRVREWVESLDHDQFRLLLRWINTLYIYRLSTIWKWNKVTKL